MLEIHRKLVSEEIRKFLFSAVKKEKWDFIHSWYVAITIFCIVCYEAVARGVDNVSHNRLKGADVSGIGLAFNYSL